MSKDTKAVIAVVIVIVIVAAIVAGAFLSFVFNSVNNSANRPDIMSLAITVNCTGCSYNTTASTYDPSVHSAESTTLISVTYSNSSWSIQNPSLVKAGNATAIYTVSRTDASHKWTVSWISHMWSNSGIMRVTVATNMGRTVFDKAVSPSYSITGDYGLVSGAWSS